MKKIGQILKAAWIWVTGKYKNLTSEDNIDAAIAAVNTIKQLSYSTLATWLVALTQTGIDDKILQIVKDRVPKTLASLQLIKSIPPNPTEAQIIDLLNSFVYIIRDNVTDRQRFLTSLAADILIALEDEKLTFGEAAAIIEKHYQGK